MLETPSRFHYDWIQEHYLSLIQSYCHRIDSSLRVLLKPVDGRRKLSRTTSPYIGNVPLVTVFQVSQTFENYVVAPFNRFALAAARAICMDDAPRFSPLFIEGPQGLGKTHLLQAIGNAWLANGSGTAAYVTCRDLPVYGTTATIGSSETVLEALAEVTIILLDDVHLIPGQGGFEQSLRQFLDLCYDSYIQMVFTANRLPRQIPDLSTGFRSRFGRGLIARIRKPDVKDCYRIIETLLGETKISVSSDYCQYLAEQCPLNFYEIKNFVERLQNFVEKEGHLPNLRERPLSIHGNATLRPQELSIQGIQNEVCVAYDVSPEAMQGATKSRSLVIARQVAMYLSRKLTGSTYAAIGEVFGGRDHSTVIYACRKVRAEMKRSRAFAERIVETERKLLEEYKEKYSVKLDS
jgi:chromosomal replication initiator protein